MAKTEALGAGTLETYTAEEVYQLFEADKIALIDVRTPVEYAFEHIKGALLSPMAWFDARHLPGQSDKPIVFHCGSGIRSRMVAEKIIAAGHAKVIHMEGGFAAWKKAGLGYMGTNFGTGAQVEKKDKPAAA